MKEPAMDRRSLRSFVWIIVIALLCVCMIWILQSENGSVVRVFADAQEQYDESSKIASGVCGKDEDR